MSIGPRWRGRGRGRPEPPREPLPVALEAWATGRPCLLNADSPVLAGQARRGGGACCSATEQLAASAERLPGGPGRGRPSGRCGTPLRRPRLRWNGVVTAARGADHRRGGNRMGGPAGGSAVRPVLIDARPSRAIRRAGASARTFAVSSRGWGDRLRLAVSVLISRGAAEPTDLTGRVSWWGRGRPGWSAVPGPGDPWLVARHCGVTQPASTTPSNTASRGAPRSGVVTVTTSSRFSSPGTPGDRGCCADRAEAAPPRGRDHRPERRHRPGLHPDRQGGSREDPRGAPRPVGPVPAAPRRRWSRRGALRPGQAYLLAWHPSSRARASPPGEVTRRLRRTTTSTW